jgi:hypothetical protein
MGIGEAIVTLLNEKGIPTPLVHTLLKPPATRMDILTPQEIQEIISQSRIARKYNEVIDTASAYELLNEKLSKANDEGRQNETDDEEVSEKAGKKEKSTLESILDNPVARQVGRTAASVITRTLLGVLGLGGTTRRRKKTSWF